MTKNGRKPDAIDEAIANSAPSPEPQGTTVDLFAIIGQKQVSIEVLQAENAELRAQLAAVLQSRETVTEQV